MGPGSVLVGVTVGFVAGNAIRAELRRRLRRMEGFVCPDCGSSEGYVTTYCNFAHCTVCGAGAHDEECWVDPRAIEAERHDDIENAIRILKGEFGAFEEAELS
jgi:hypothetical protein